MRERLRTLGPSERAGEGVSLPGDLLPGEMAFQSFLWLEASSRLAGAEALQEVKGLRIQPATPSCHCGVGDTDIAVFIPHLVPSPHSDHSDESWTSEGLTIK